ncbi:MAG: LysR family transcriptional regulator [Caldimonas sp.]
MTKRTQPIVWDRLRLFNAVVEAGSFTHAARKLQLSQSAVSRQVSALEESLNVSLFYRHARGLMLTEHGQMFSAVVNDMDNRLAQGLARLAASRSKTDGPLRITTTVTFGSAWLSSRIAKFHWQYPDIAVSLHLVDTSELDLLAREADVAVRFAEQTNPNLIQRRLMSSRYHLYASKEYIAQRGIPKTTQALDHHELIVYGNDAEIPFKNFDWILQVGRDPGVERKPALKVNSVYAIYRAVKSGLGIGALPYYIVEEAPDLVEVLPDVAGPTFDAYFVYPEALRGSKSVSVLRDFLLEQVEHDAGLPASEIETLSARVES